MDKKDAALQKFEEFYFKAESAVTRGVDSNFNYIKNLRKNISNESNLFGELLLNKAIQIGLIILLIDIVLFFVNRGSILGIGPKVVALIILQIVKFKFKGRLM